MIDQIDRDLIRLLQSDARLTQRELGRSVGLSPNAAGARVQRLVRDGVIAGYHVAVDHAALGRPLEATIDVWLNEATDRTAVERLVREDDRIVECFHLTGPVDFRIRARVSDPADLNELLMRLRGEGRARQTDSRLVLEYLSTTAGSGD